MISCAADLCLCFLMTRLVLFLRGLVVQFTEIEHCQNVHEDKNAKLNSRKKSFVYSGGLQPLKTIHILSGQFLARLHEVQKSYCSHPGRTRSHSRYPYRSCSRSRHTLLKFSRSLYLDNQLSESIHTLTIGTL